MAIVKITVDSKTGSAYFPKKIREGGFVGQMDGMPYALTLTLIKPGAKPADVQQSLEIMLQDLALQRHYEEGNNITEGENEPKAEGHKAQAMPQHPLFLKYTRDWLHRETGYSKGYISRIATGKIPLARFFIERVCVKLQRPEAELFLPDVRRGNSL